jgi:ribosomal protein S18 acetylase RimI-like enzyme
MQIKSLSELEKLHTNQKHWSDVEAIFFEASVKKSFSSEEEKKKFRYKYLDWYAQHHPECFFVAVNSETDKTAGGYICGAPDTLADTDLSILHPWFEVFSECFRQYPAHLHINCAASARGQGLGHELLIAFENHMRSKNVAGLHLVTSPDARNVGFYSKNGYTFTKIAHWKGTALLLMGKTL